MVAGRSPGTGWESGVSAQWHSARRDNLTGAGQCVSALRAGPLVRAADTQREQGAVRVVPLCGRLRGLLPVSARGGGIRKSAPGTVGQVRIGSGARENQDAAL